MQLFFMRHGEAGHDAPSDRERSLTDVGRYHCALMSRWLAKSVEQFDLVLVSPYLRAQQSWEEVNNHFLPPRKWLTLDDLTPLSDPVMAVDLALAYAEQYRADKVLIIAHMPLLSFMASELVRGLEPPLFATSGISLIDVHGEQASLSWQQNPHSVSV